MCLSCLFLCRRTSEGLKYRSDEAARARLYIHKEEIHFPQDRAESQPSARREITQRMRGQKMIHSIWPFPPTVWAPTSVGYDVKAPKLLNP